MPEGLSIIRNLGNVWACGPVSSVLVFMEMACVPGFAEDRMEGGPVPDLLVSPRPLPTTFRVLKCMVTLHGTEKKADSQGRD